MYFSSHSCVAPAEALLMLCPYSPVCKDLLIETFFPKSKIPREERRPIPLQEKGGVLSSELVKQWPNSVGLQWKLASLSNLSGKYHCRHVFICNIIIIQVSQSQQDGKVALEIYNLFHRIQHFLFLSSACKIETSLFSEEIIMQKFSSIKVTFILLWFHSSNLTCCRNRIFKFNI